MLALKHYLLDVDALILGGLGRGGGFLFDCAKGQNAAVLLRLVLLIVFVIDFFISCSPLKLCWDLESTRFRKGTVVGGAGIEERDETNSGRFGERHSVHLAEAILRQVVQLLQLG